MPGPLARCVLVALAARVVAILAWPTPPSWDGYYYARLAAQLAAGRGYTEPLAHGDIPTAFWPPGLPFALAPALAMGAAPQTAAALVNLAAAALGCVAVYKAAEDLGAAAARRAALTYALYPGLVLWSTAAMTETLTGALLAASLHIALRRNAFLAGVGVGLATLTRPPSLLLAAAPLGRQGGLRALALCVAGALAAVAPWSLRNAVTLDGAALVSTNGGSNLLIGATSHDGGYQRLHRAHPRCDLARGEVTRDRCWQGLAVQAIARDPLRWAAGAAVRVLRTFAVERDPAAHLAWSRRPPPAWLKLALGALCTASWWALLVAAARARGRDVRTSVATLALGATALTHGIFLGADRYHLVLVPLLCPLVGARRR